MPAAPKSAPEFEIKMAEPSVGSFGLITWLLLRGSVAGTSVPPGAGLVGLPSRRGPSLPGWGTWASFSCKTSCLGCVTALQIIALFS